MNPVTHLLLSWTIAERSKLDLRDRKIVTWSGLVPDLDGLSVIPDILHDVLKQPPTEYFFLYHHRLTHGLPAALICSAVAAALSRSRFRTAVWAFLVFHVHLLCDLVGSRGPDPGDIWPIHYLAPLSGKLSFQWSGQWPLNAWPNIALTVLLLIYVFVQAVRKGESPLLLFSQRANEVFVATLRNRFQKAA
ncbi:MAG TPA: metal-dependent hydrolase [Acidobacteriota bacterium]|nr:metal-dependent hydrolase [Acidobacteriota bacterium]